jgi:hypothetical protein
MAWMCLSSRNHHYFKSFLLHRFVLTIHSHLCQPQHSSCSTCVTFKLFGLSLISQISRFAHSGFGEGELAHHLLKGEQCVQRLLAVCVPYIVRLVPALNVTASIWSLRLMFQRLSVFPSSGGDVPQSFLCVQTQHSWHHLLKMETQVVSETSDANSVSQHSIAYDCPQRFCHK